MDTQASEPQHTPALLGDTRRIMDLLREQQQVIITIRKSSNNLARDVEQPSPLKEPQEEPKDLLSALDQILLTIERNSRDLYEISAKLKDLIG